MKLQTVKRVLWGLCALAILLMLLYMLTKSVASIISLAAVLLGMLLYGALVLILRMFTAEELTYIPGGRRLLASARMRKLVR